MESLSQAGGHADSLIPRGDKLLKRAKKNEIGFYEYLYSSELRDVDMLEFRKFAPDYYGTELIESHNYIIVENLLSGYLHASILDCKVGKVIWTPEHDEAKTKRQQDAAARTTTSTLGFRICGIVQKDQQGNIIGSSGKYQLEPTDDNAHEQFRRIVTRGDIILVEFVDQFIRDTQEILD